MEILMKVKCTPARPGSAPHPTLKVVDQHQQLQQHTATRLQPSHHSMQHMPHGTPDILPVSNCLDYRPVDCCSGSAYGQSSNDGQNYMEWPGMHSADGRNEASSAGFSSGCCGPYGNSCCNNDETIMQYDMKNHSNDQTSHGSFEYQEPEENFVSIDDAKVKGFLMKMGEDKRQSQTTTSKIKEKQKYVNKQSINVGSVVYEIIELDEERETKEENESNTESAANISQVNSSVKALSNQQSKAPFNLMSHNPPINKTLKSSPKSSKPERIIAEIELLDSSNDSNSQLEKSDRPNPTKVTNEKPDYNEDFEDYELPLTAVSCELQYDDSGDDSSLLQPLQIKSVTNNFVLPEEDFNDYNDRSAHGREIRNWDEYDDTKEKIFFECYLCGKKVQSNYNLRRHMMIHTGERPFGCDLCDRRFREFSDLKKHRRRHIKEPNYFCMVCKVERPAENDSTCCLNCDVKKTIFTAPHKLPKVNDTLESCATPSTEGTSNITIQTVHAKKSYTGHMSVSPTTVGSNTNATSPLPTLKISHTSPPITISKMTAAKPALLGTSSKSSSSVASPASIPSPSQTPPSSQPTKIRTVLPDGVAANSNAFNPYGLSNEDNLLIDNLAPIQRTGYNELGPITRKEYACPKCKRPFSTRHNLKRHYMIHTGERPFSCSKCRKPFRELSTLKKHMVTHLKTRFYKCSVCPEKFEDFLAYTTHKSTHPEDNLFDDDDEVPSKKQKLYLNYESNDDDSNEGGDWLECCECNQRFTDIDAYTMHLKEHDPSEFLYECYLCKITFSAREELVKHMTDHESKI